MSFINKIRKLICHRQYVNPIVDENIYQNLEKSYSGGSLSESNLLVVTNIPIPEDLILKIQKNENVSISVLCINGGLSREDIVSASKELIGPFTHIVNLYRKDENMSLLTASGEYPKTDDMYRVYQWLQEEVSYLVPLELYATICTAFISDDSDYSFVLKKNMEMLVLSLGDVLANHSIINNGIIASNKVKLVDILQTALFMSSKYGQILGGGNSFTIIKNG